MKLYFRINFFFLYLLRLFIYINCQSLYNNKNTSYEKYCNSNLYNTKSHSFSLNENNYKKDDFDSVIINKTIIAGIVQTETMYNPFIYKFEFSYIDIKEDLLVHFYPLDCQIKIVAINENDYNISIQNISNYDYDSYFAVIKKEKLNTSYFKIKPLINSIDDNNKNRTFHLIINSFENNNNPQLYLNEKQPTLIYFDSLNNITLSYELNNTCPENPVVFSFFIKERAKFEIKILDNQQNKKIIAYKDNIIVGPESFSKESKCKISIFISKYENKTSDMIVKVTGNYTSYSYLQKNKLNLGFMPIDITEQHYYMEVFKGEEGEIMLNNKWQNGKLSGVIIDKEKINKNDLQQVRNNNDLIFNEYSQKLTFTSNDTLSCEKGCYLLINYYSKIFDLTNLIGTEFTLLSKIWDEEEFVPQIVNIPLNEYIFGTFEYSSIMVHYYSIYLPEDNNVIIEIQGINNIGIEAKKGIQKMNFIYNKNSVLLKEAKYDTNTFNLIITLNKTELGLNSFKNQFISFAFKKSFYVGNSFSNYYFRIIQQNLDKKYLVYPLNTNKANICQAIKTNESKYSCFFLFKNDYKQLDYYSFIYAYGKKQIQYELWPMEQNDCYSIDIDNIINMYKELSGNNSYYKIDRNINKDFILIKLTSNSEEILTVFFNFYDQLKSIPSLNIYSYQIFYLENNQSIDINFTSLLPNQYRIFINSTMGLGHISFYENYEKKKFILSQDIFYSYHISEDIKNVHIVSDNNLIFNIKIDYQIPNKVMEEIYFGDSTKTTNKYFEMYYIQDKYNYGIDINFYFHPYDNKENKFSIVGYVFDYDVIKNINVDSGDFLSLLVNNNCPRINGTYDNSSKNGLLIFDKEIGNNIYGISNIDKFYLIIISRIYNDKSLNLEIQVNSKNGLYNILPYNKFIRGSFNLLKNSYQTQSYLISVNPEELNKNIIYILEFSSNCQYIELVFNDNFTFYKKKNWGKIQYFFSTQNLTNNSYNIIVQLNNTNKEKNKGNSLELANYILRFHKDEKKNNFDYIFNLSHTFEKINNKSDNTSYYNLTLKTQNEYENNYIDDNYIYTYYLRLISKNNSYNNEILNTTALITSKINNYNIINTSEIKNFSFIFNDLPKNECFVASLFITVKDKINDKNIFNNEVHEEDYFSICFDFNTKEKSIDNDQDKKNINLIIILSVSFGCFLIIITLIFIFVCKSIKKKNKILEEKIKAISFSIGIDEESFDIDSQKSKKDEEYETTFI